MALSFRIDTRHSVVLVRAEQRLTGIDLVAMISSRTGERDDLPPCRVADLRDVTVCVPTEADLDSLIAGARTAGREFSRTAIITGHTPVKRIAEGLAARLQEVQAFTTPEQANAWLGIHAGWDVLDALREQLTGRTAPVQR